jgi:hypothetical protein
MPGEAEPDLFTNRKQPTDGGAQPALMPSINRPSASRASRALGALLVSAAGVTTLSAQLTWNGEGADSNWTTGANWIGGLAPLPGDGANALVFGGSQRLDAHADEPFQLRTLVFGAGASAFTLGGSQLTFMAGQSSFDPPSFIRNDSSALQTINNAVLFNGQSPYILAAAGDLRFNGGISFVNMGGSVFGFEGGTGRTITVAGLSGEGGEGLFVEPWSGGVTVVLTGASTLTGQHSIGLGTTLQLGDGGTSGSIAQGVTIQGFNGTLRVNRSDSVVLDQVFVGSGTIEHAGSGQVTLSGMGPGFGSQIRVNGGGVFVAETSAALGGTASFHVANASTLRFGEGVNHQPSLGVTFTVSGESVVEIDGTIRASGSMFEPASGSTFADSTLRVRDGGYLWSGRHTLTGDSLLEVEAGGEIGSGHFVFRDNATFVFAEGSTIGGGTFHFAGEETANRVLDLSGKKLPAGTLEFSRITAEFSEGGFLGGDSNFYLYQGSDVTVSAAGALANTEGAVEVHGGSRLRLSVGNALSTQRLSIIGEDSLVEVGAADGLAVSQLTIDDAAELHLGGHDLTVKALSVLSGSRLVGGGVGPVAITVNAEPGFGGSTLDGTVSDGEPGSGPLSITFSGDGFGAVLAPQAYTGTTRITNGFLLAVHDFGGIGQPFLQGPVEVDSGGRLAGTGSVRDVFVNQGGVLSPGDRDWTPAVSTLFAENVTLAGDTAFEFDLYDTAFDPDIPFQWGADTGWDRLVVEGEFRFSAGVGDTFTLLLRSGDENISTLFARNFDPSQSYSFGFLIANGGIFDFDASRASVDTSEFGNAFDGAWSLRQAGNTLYLDYTAVPEPASVAGLAGLAALGLAALRRRRRG